MPYSSAMRFNNHFVYDRTSLMTYPVLMTMSIQIEETTRKVSEVLL